MAVYHGAANATKDVAQLNPTQRRQARIRQKRQAPNAAEKEVAAAVLVRVCISTLHHSHLQGCR